MRVSLFLAFLSSCYGEVIPVGRNDYEHIVATCNKGINQQVEAADPITECADALNVWAPNGRVEQRPGYVGIVSVMPINSTATELSARAHDTSAGTFGSPAVGGVLTLSGLVGRVADGNPDVAVGHANYTDQDRWYLGHTSRFRAVDLVITAANANSTRFYSEYWNGSAWKFLNVIELERSGTNGTYRDRGYHLRAPSSGSVATFLFANPQDWQSTVVNSLDRFWIRFSLLDADLDGATSVDVLNASTLIYGDADVRGMFAVQFPSEKQYRILTLEESSGTKFLLAHQSLTLDMDHVVRTSDQTSFDEGEPANIAVVPQFEEAYIAYGYRIMRTMSDYGNNPVAIATVEDRDYLVGPGADFDKNLITQHATFPYAKYVQFFKGQLWAAHLQGYPHNVRWSGPAPYHRVWPVLNEEPLVENDNSPITGLRGYGEHMTVFKNDSVWLMVDTGFSEFDLQTYAPTKVVSGVGCVSNSSIKEVRGQLFFLAEDGVYAFNGTPNIKKLSDRIQPYIDRITPGRRPFATAAHWRKKSVYMLAVSLDGSDANSHVLVYDYKNDAWWVWDNIEAQHWLEDEGSYDDEKIYFGDSVGSIFELGPGATDHGNTITSNVVTHRLAYGDRSKKVFREVRLFGDSQFTDPTITLIPNDNDSFFGTLQSATLDMTDPVETVNKRPLQRRNRRLDFRTEGDWAQVKVANATKNERLVMSAIDVGYRRMGRR